MDSFIVLTVCCVCVRMVQVNKFNVRYSTHQQAVQWLVSQDGDIELLIQHVPQPPGLIVRQLNSSANHISVHTRSHIHSYPCELTLPSWSFQ